MMGSVRILLKFSVMEIYVDLLAIKRSCNTSLLALMLCAAPHLLRAQAVATPAVPDWALPGSPTHVQVTPPADFHRASRNFDTPIGVFNGQSNIGAAVVAGGGTFFARTTQTRRRSAGATLWCS